MSCEAHSANVSQVIYHLLLIEALVEFQERLL